MNRSFACLALLLLVACERVPEDWLGGGSGGSPGGGGAGGGTAACLLEYNTALVTGDACCLYEKGANTCDTKIQCNERSGTGCCLIYGTSATVGGSRCCLYADGSYGDSPDECRSLLSAQ